MNLSVVIVTFNEEANLGRTLESVKALVADGKGEIIIVDSGSTDRTVEIAISFGAKVFVEEWKGYAAQKNSAIDKAAGDWILSLDADEEVTPELATEIERVVESADAASGALRCERGDGEPMPGLGELWALVQGRERAMAPAARSGGEAKAPAEAGVR